MVATAITSLKVAEHGVDALDFEQIVWLCLWLDVGSVVEARSGNDAEIGESIRVGYRTDLETLSSSPTCNLD